MLSSAKPGDKETLTGDCHYDCDFALSGVSSLKIGLFCMFAISLFIHCFAIFYPLFPMFFLRPFNTNFLIFTFNLQDIQNGPFLFSSIILH